MASAPNQSYYRFYYCLLLCDKLNRKVIFMHISLCYYVSQFIKEIHLIINFINSSLFVSPYFIRYVKILLRVGQKTCETEGGSDTPFRTMAK